MIDFMRKEKHLDACFSRLNGNISNDEMVTLLTRGDIKNIDGVSCMFPNLQKYAHDIGNLLSYNGNIEDSQLLSLCFSEHVLQNQLPSSLDEFHDSFETGYYTGDLYMKIIGVFDELFNSQYPSTPKNNNDVLFDVAFNDSYIIYYVLFDEQLVYKVVSDNIEILPYEHTTERNIQKLVNESIRGLL